MVIGFSGVGRWRLNRWRICNYNCTGPGTLRNDLPRATLNGKKNEQEKMANELPTRLKSDGLAAPDAGGAAPTRYR